MVASGFKAEIQKSLGIRWVLGIQIQNWQKTVIFQQLYKIPGT